MICKNCGTDNEAGSKFCVSCGSVLEQPTPEIIQPTAQDYVHVDYTQQNAYATPVAVPQEAGDPGKALGIVGMVLGICSLIFFWIPIFSWFSLIFGTVGLILSIIGKSKSAAAGHGNGMAIAGIICAAIGTGLSFLMSIIYLILMIAAL